MTGTFYIYELLSLSDEESVSTALEKVLDAVDRTAQETQPKKKASTGAR